MIYVIGLRFWNVVTPYFILMYFLEEVPNFYNLLVCVCSLFDDYLPSNVMQSSIQLQRVLYYWKPPVYLLAFIVLILDMVPMVFGCYIWYKGDGKSDKEVGQATMVEALAVLLPYSFSLILLFLSLEYLRADLTHLTFAGYRAQKKV